MCSLEGKSTKKGQGQIGYILMALLVAALFIGGMAQYVGTLHTRFGVDDESMSGVINASSALSGDIHSLQNKTTGLTEDPNTLSGLEGITAVTATVFNVISFTTNLGGAIVEMTDLPIAWVVPYLVIMVILIVSLAVANWLRGGGASL